jgi:Alkylmercury lyase
MHGSPTILVDGTDPFAEPGQSPTVSCRLYRDRGGRVDGAPSVSQLREVIGEPAAAAGGAGSPAWLDALGRSGRGRVAPAEGGLRAVHHTVLRSFAATGRAPEQGVLAEGDFLYLDQAGQISAAYPFSAAPTSHKVQIAGGPSAYAMCAIDALGMARMLRASVAIRSADPATGEPVTVTVSDHAVWHPDTAVVFVGRTASACAGPSASVCCEYINFFASHSAAAAWATAHPEVTGGILSQDRALEVGQQIFGQLLQ